MEPGFLRQLVGRFPIAHKVSLVLVTLSVVTLMTLWVIVSKNFDSLLQDLSNTFGRTIAQQIANASAEPVLAEDLLSLKVIVSKITEAPNVSGAVLFDVQENILAQSGIINEVLDVDLRPVSDPKNGVYFSAITFQDVVAGYALIHLDKKRITTSIKTALNLMTIATFIIMAICFVLAFYLGRHITEPVKQLTRAADEIRAGNLDYRITQNRHDEIGVLMDSFNSMAQGIKEREQLEDTFNLYVSPNIANNILSNLEDPAVPTKYVNASVLFVDIVGFTAMCETLSPDEVVKVLNDYYGYILAASSLYRGTVDKFIGDGAMVIFGVPDADESHSFNAICCAELFIQLVGHFNRERQAAGLPIIEFRLAIHAGEMLAGTLGCAEQMQYTVIGDTVNIAARLCQHGIPGKLIVSHQAYRNAQGADRLLTQPPYALDIRGRSSQISVHLVREVKAPYSRTIKENLMQVLRNLRTGNQIESIASHPG